MTEKLSFGLKKAGESHTHPAAAKLSKKVIANKQTRINFLIAEDKHKAFKLAAMKNGKTMSEAVTGFVDDYLAKHGAN